LNSHPVCRWPVLNATAAQPYNHSHEICRYITLSVKNSHKKVVYLEKYEQLRLTGFWFTFITAQTSLFLKAYIHILHTLKRDHAS